MIALFSGKHASVLVWRLASCSCQSYLLDFLFQQQQRLKEFDRATINAWEDEEFVTAVKATGRKKLIMTALWTEACLSFPALDALREGYV